MVSCNLVHMFGSSLMFLRIQERLEGAKASARKIAVFNAMRYRNYRFYPEPQNAPCVSPDPD